MCSLFDAGIQRAREGEVFANVSAGADMRANTRGGGALERGHGALLERLAQLGNALGGVGTLDITITIFVEAAELVRGQAASTGKGSVNGR